MRARPALLLLAVTCCALFAGAAPALAAPVTYVVSLGNTQNSTLTLDGDQLTGLSLTTIFESCSVNSTESAHTGLPATAVSLSGNALHIATDSEVQGYPGSTVHVVLDGTASADRRVISGTITLSGLHTPFDDGCPATTRKFVAIPKPATVPPDPEHQWSFSIGRLMADAVPGHITRLALNVPFACGKSVNAVDFDTRAYTIADIPLSSTGTFSLTLYVLDEYTDARILTITGQLTGNTLTARFQVAAPDVGLGPDECVGDATFTSTSATVSPPTTTPITPGFGPNAPVTPPTGGHQTLPRKSGPYASFDWLELRISRGAVYTYYFMVDNLRCAGRATHVRIAIHGRRSRRLSCRHRRAFASGPVIAGADYRLTAQALRIKRGRILKRGPSVATLLRMRTPLGGWAPTKTIPGRPPSA